jgi:hypothetical protein
VRRRAGQAGVHQGPRDGNERANEIADATLAKVRAAMTMTYPAG